MKFDTWASNTPAFQTQNMAGSSGTIVGCINMPDNTIRIITYMSLQISKHQRPMHDHSMHEHPKSIGFCRDTHASTSKALEAPSRNDGPGMLALLMLMDGDADQPGISNDLDGVVWHVDASDNHSSLVCCLESWCIEAQVSNFTLFLSQIQK